METEPNESQSWRQMTEDEAREICALMGTELTGDELEVAVNKIAAGFRVDNNTYPLVETPSIETSP